ncbi:MAG: hypothetical protein JO353_04055, partial [Phycisphaerae bacterium]|nr:hypothetical protein [Phycisphaerae bacterium]
MSVNPADSPPVNRNRYVTIRIALLVLILGLIVTYLFWPVNSEILPGVHSASIEKRYFGSSLRACLDRPVERLDCDKGLVTAIDWIVVLVILSAAFAARRAISFGIAAREFEWLKRIFSPSVFLVLLTSSLLWFRLPVISSPWSLGLDESVFLSGAITLKYDPVFWRTVESTTSGPLNYYPLMLP